MEEIVVVLSCFSYCLAGGFNPFEKRQMALFPQLIAFIVEYVFPITLPKWNYI